MILEKIPELKPHKVLDLGCGCGSYTARLSSYCREITAVDCHPGLIERCRKEIVLSNVTFECMDGRSLAFADGSFDVVLERESLHHSLEWERILDEMLRVSSRLVLIEEPLDDIRTDEKKNTLHARELFLELQNEVRYPHYSHIPLQALTGYLTGRSTSFDVFIRKSDILLQFDEYFDSFSYFADRSARKEYWYGRLDALRKELCGRKLCEDDRVLIVASI